MCGGGAGEPRGAVEVVADCGDCGEARQAFASGGQDDQLAAEASCFTERLAAASVSPVSSAASPNLPRSSIHS